MEITTVELEELTRISFRKNKDRYLSKSVVQKAMEDTGFVIIAGKGRGNPDRFLQTSTMAEVA